MINYIFKNLSFKIWLLAKNLNRYRKLDHNEKILQLLNNCGNRNRGNAVPECCQKPITELASNKLRCTTGPAPPIAISAHLDLITKIDILYNVYVTGRVDISGRLDQNSKNAFCSL